MYKGTRKTSHNSDYDLAGDFDRMKEIIADLSRDVKGRAGEAINQRVDNARKKTEEVGDYIGDQPFKSLGVAMLAGIAIGYLLNR